MKSKFVLEHVELGLGDTGRFGRNMSCQLWVDAWQKQRSDLIDARQIFGTIGDRTGLKLTLHALVEQWSLLRCSGFVAERTFGPAQSLMKE